MVIALCVLIIITTISKLNAVDVLPATDVFIIPTSQQSDAFISHIYNTLLSFRSKESLLSMAQLLINRIHEFMSDEIVVATWNIFSNIYFQHFADTEAYFQFMNRTKPTPQFTIETLKIILNALFENTKDIEHKQLEQSISTIVIKADSYGIILDYCSYHLMMRIFSKQNDCYCATELALFLEEYPLVWHDRITDLTLLLMSFKDTNDEDYREILSKPRMKAAVQVPIYIFTVVMPYWKVQPTMETYSILNALFHNNPKLLTTFQRSRDDIFVEALMNVYAINQDFESVTTLLLKHNITIGIQCKLTHIYDNMLFNLQTVQQFNALLDMFALWSHSNVSNEVNILQQIIFYTFNYVRNIGNIKPNLQSYELLCVLCEGIPGLMDRFAWQYKGKEWKQRSDKMSHASRGRYGRRAFENVDPDAHEPIALLVSRLRQIHMGKETKGYQNYVSVVALEDREEDNEYYPQTPDATKVLSKRQFDKNKREWRRALHRWEEQFC